MSSSGELKDFFIQIGFAVDEASRKKVAKTHAQTESGLTAATVAELERRKAAEAKMMTDRVNAVVSVGAELEREERAHADRLLKIQQEQADKDRKLQDESAKKANTRRTESFKAMQTFALNAAAVAAKTITAVEGTALALTYAVDRTAKKFESLGYIGQRSGGSARGITAFTYAASQLGSSFDAASSSLERFGDNLKRLPGYRNMLENLGVRTRDARGNMRDSADIATDFGAKLRQIRDSDPQLGYARSLAYAGNVGLDDDTARALMDPRFRQYADERKAEQAKVGFDANGASAGAMRFEQAMRKVQAVVEDVLDRLRANLFDKIGPIVDQLSQWLTQHGRAISDAVGALAEGLVKVAAAFAKSDLLANGVEAVTSGLQVMAKYLGSDSFKKDVEALADGFSRIAKGIVVALRYIGFLPGSASAAEARPPSLVPGSTPPDGTLADTGLRGLMNAAYRGRHDIPAWVNERAKRLGNRLRGYDNTHVSEAGPRSRGFGPNMTAENATAIKDAAKELGTTPQDLATVIGYETGGTFSPSKWGGKGGNYMGLIQFGPSERTQYGANENQSFKEQMGAVVRYLKGRGFKPGMGLKDLYSTINAGRPGLYGASDGNGTVESHVANMQGATAAKARALLAMADPATDPAKPTARVPFSARLPASPFGTLDPNAFKTAPLGPSMSSIYQSYDYSRAKGDNNLTQNFTINGGDNKANLDAARFTASRGHMDFLRNMQGSEQ